LDYVGPLYQGVLPGATVMAAASFETLSTSGSRSAGGGRAR